MPSLFQAFVGALKGLMWKYGLHTMVAPSFKDVLLNLRGKKSLSIFLVMNGFSTRENQSQSVFCLN